MTQKADGMNYAPESKARPVVEPGEFVFSAAHLDHGHINGQTNGLLEAGATLRHVYDPDPKKVEAFLKRYPQAKAVDSLDRILEDDEVKLVTSAAIPVDRGPIGLRVMDAGKDYFTDKSPFTTLDQLSDARAKVAETGKKYAVYYAERLHNLAGYHVGEMLRQGLVGDVLQVILLAPHRLAKGGRPGWFFEKQQYGGILTDIGSHQFEQALHYASASNAQVNFARVDNFANADKPGLEDFGEANLTLDNGASFYTRIDWFTPDGLQSWGDGRCFVLGDKGYVEMRKYMDFGDPDGTFRVFFADKDKETEIHIDRDSGFPYFGQLILDCLNRTENAMTQEHAFMAAELSMKSQAMADALR